MARNGETRLAAAAGARSSDGAPATAALVAGRSRGAEDERKYRLHADEGAAAGVRRIAHGQIDRAIEALEGDDDRDEAIHEARKALKRLRALVRLSRDELGDDVYRRENRGFRDAGRRLSGVRDAAVLVETLDALIDGHREELGERPFAGLREALAAEARVARVRIEADPAPIKEVLAELRDARERVDAWPLRDEAGVEMLAPGMQRIYRRGRRALRAAREDPDDESIHELRKRAKDLWHAAQVVRPASPKRLRKLGRRAHALSDAAGDDHDHAVLLDAARRKPRWLAPGEAEVLEALVARRREELQHDALDIGSRVYARKPRKLATRVQGTPGPSAPA
jgi:CHAD domain-containing protein